MVSEPLDELYFKWLYELVAEPNFEEGSLTYWHVLKILFEKEFVWVVANDENRIQDGKALRIEFLNVNDIQTADSVWIELGCSVLELMVGLARRFAFEADGEPHYWFWVLMDNLGLFRFSDDTVLPEERIDDLLDRFIYRKYEPSGLGGLFPLENPREDQRKVELWYQLSEYIMERGLAG